MAKIFTFTMGWRHSKEGGGVMLMMRVLGRPSTVSCVEVKEQINQRMRDNRRNVTVGTVSKRSISHGKKRCQNGLRTSRKYLIVMQSGNVCVVGQYIEKEGDHVEKLDI
jgi:hypothetical protein